MVAVTPVGLLPGLLKGLGGSVKGELSCASNFVQVTAMPGPGK